VLVAQSGRDRAEVDESGRDRAEIDESGRDRAEIDETGRDRAEVGGSISASEVRGSTHLGAISADLGARPLATDGDATTLDLVNQELTLT